VCVCMFIHAYICVYMCVIHPLTKEHKADYVGICVCACVCACECINVCDCVGERVSVCM
jgi:hypothetical protein